MNRLSATLKTMTPPAWLAVVFVVCLPLTRGLRDAMGIGLQQLSAAAATALLGVFYRVHQEGIRMLLTDQDILLELPSASAQYAMSLLLIFAILILVKRPGWRQSAEGFVHVLALIYGVNTVRITFLATGVAFPNLVGHINVMAQVWHDRIALISMLVFGLLPMLHWARGLQFPRKKSGRCHSIVTQSKQKEIDMYHVESSNPPNSPVVNRSLSWRKRLKIGLACLFVATVLGAVSLPSMDVNVPVRPVPLSVFLAETNEPVLAFTSQDAFDFTQTLPQEREAPRTLGKRPKRTLAFNP